MKILTGIPVIFALAMASCSSGEEKKAKEARMIEMSSNFQQQLKVRRTRSQGEKAARKHHQENGFQIARYDFPIVRTGYWPHYVIYEHFGIKEGGLAFTTLEFDQGWNAEMDRLLIKRYGEEYRKYRKAILPPLGAKIGPMKAQLMQPEFAYEPSD